jgi:TPR repeat protein
VTRAALRRAVLVVAALAFAGAAQARSRDTRLPPVPEPAKAWPRYLATGKLEDAFRLYRVIDAVEDSRFDVVPAACEEQRAVLAEAIRTIPVGVAFWYAAYRCAQATGHDKEAERYLAGFGALAKYALAQGSEELDAPPIRVVASADIRALVQAAGMDLRYEFFEGDDTPRYLVIEQAVWDAKAGHERHLRYDFLDTLVLLSRDDPEAAWPSYRHGSSRSIVRDYAQAGIDLAQDLQAARDAGLMPSLDEKLARLRLAAEHGGVQSAWNWLAICHKARTPGCGDGLIDALLPAAEHRYAVPTLLLALAHAEGIGVEPDEAKAMALLDAAEAQWGGGHALVEYSRYYLALARRPLPEPLLVRLRAHAATEPVLARLLVTARLFADPQTRITDAEVASLRALHAGGYPYAAVTLGRALFNAGRHAEAREWLLRAAQMGDAAAQELYGRVLYHAMGGPADRKAALRWWQLAAAGGDTDAMLALGHLAAGQARWADAARWYRSAAEYGEADAAMQLAQLYEQAPPDLEGGGLAEAARIYGELDKHFDSAPARRQLARLLAFGLGVPRDAERARTLLEKDAQTGDIDSQVVLARAWLTGAFGAADAATAQRWLQKGIEAGDAKALDVMAYYLFYQRHAEGDRAQALALWRRTLAHDGAEESWNNLAWVLCTGIEASLRAPAEGLAVAARLGDPAKLPAAWLDTVAACHAAAGDTRRAAKLQAQVVKRVAADTPASTALPGMRARLALYRDGQAFVEPARDAPGAP